MKRLLSFFFLAVLAFQATAQLNMSLFDQVQYDVSLSDVWGWANPTTGEEFAIVGLRDGTSIVDVSDPANSVQVAFIPGDNSTWRDIKTWGDYAYVTCDEGDDGLLVIDMSDLPNSAPSYYWNPNIDGQPLRTAHNIYIDEGYAYLAGANVNNGGALILDVFSDPGNPIVVNSSNLPYAHDIYTRDNLMYHCEIYAGVFAIYDVTDKTNPQLLGSQPTPYNFTHNAWLSTDGDYLFTTDEVANAPVAAYDVSDPSDIQYQDEYAPLETLGDGVIPHNVHVVNTVHTDFQDFLAVSYYTDGGIIIDAVVPDNLIEVGNFDTFFGGGQGFQGAWGLYPYLPSGIVLVSDIGDGLYVLDVDYVGAARLHGTVTDAVTGNALSDVNVSIFSGDLNQADTDFSGEYKTGQVTAGTFEVEFTKTGFFPKTVEATLVNGEITILDVELEPIAFISGQIIDAETGLPVPEAEVAFRGLTGQTGNFDITAETDGSFALSGFAPGLYDVFAGKWGYLHAFVSQEDIGNNAELVIEISEGYQDDFILDLGWIATADASTSTGFWELGEPVGTIVGGGALGNPDNDIAGDYGDQCYVTGNGGGDAGAFDIDDGGVYLTSPAMDLTSYNEPTIQYQLWFYNSGGNGNPDDQLEVIISNGTDEVVLETITSSESMSTWRPLSEFNLTGMINITNNMTLRIETGDTGNGHLVEAALDVFAAFDGNPINSINEVNFNANLTVSPNPFKDNVGISFELFDTFETANILIYNTLGQEITQKSFTTNTASFQFGNTLNAGVYTIQLVVDGQTVKTEKIVKVD